MLLYVCLIGGESRDFIEASFGSTQVALLDVDHAEVVPRLNILRFHLHDPEEASLGRCQVAVVVDVDVAEQYQSLDVVRMMLKPRAGLVIETSSRPTPRSRPRASRPNTRPRFRATRLRPRSRPNSFQTECQDEEEERRIYIRQTT